MAIYLRPLTSDELSGWLADQREDYIEERIRAGETPEEANRVAAEQYRVLFPEGQPAAGHEITRVMDDEQPVGWLWIGPRSAEHPEAFWVWNVAIDEPYRGAGRGRTAMLLAEQRAKAAGAVELGLNVFGHNTVARALYESLGYETTAVLMRKDLSTG